MKPYWNNGHSELHLADARAIPLPDKSVHCAVTSPPYWGLRSYGLGDSGIGNEPTLQAWVENIVAVSREVRRVLRDDGTYWLNLGDAYAGSGKGQSPAGNVGMATHAQLGEHWNDSGSGLPTKNLMGQPWRVAFALQDDGWFLRSAIVWAKPNPMPESVTDRPTSAYEMVFLLTKKPKYFYDSEAIRTHNPEGNKQKQYATNMERNDGGDTNSPRMNRTRSRADVLAAGSNARNVWDIPTQGRPEAHFATFPDELPRRCILAGTSEHGVCGRLRRPVG